MTATTIRDVAKHAGVGVGTVSRVINDSTAVSEPTRQKVLAAIEALNYSPNLAARRLSRGKTMTLGIVVPFFTNPSVVKRLQGVVSVLADSEYDLVLFDVEHADKRYILRNVVKRELADGLLVISLTPTDEDVSEFNRAQMPTVLVDAYHPALSHAIVDNVAGGFTATEHLIKLGHRKIGFLSDLLDSAFNAPIVDRYKGYKKALAAHDIPFQPAYHVQSSLNRDDARQVAHSLLSLPDPPTGIFAYSDNQAIGVLDAARELGLKVPDELSVIGFDNIDVAEFVQLTTIRQSLFTSGVKGAELLLSEMETPAAEPQEILLPINLVIRNTTAPPKG